ncbi:MAG: HAMP domain-containing histidine kinase [Anaerolineae bacterium]|nr:HAMP domain-containing histidine kinase [Anaerolineae bacterium]
MDFHDVHQPDIAVIPAHVDALLQDPSLTDQQRTFVQHIQKLTQPMLPAMSVTTQNNAFPWLRVVLRDAAITPLQTIIGYAKLLLERPQQFGTETISESQQQNLQAIHQQTVTLYNWLHALNGMELHKQWSNTPATVFSLDTLLAPLSTILAYHLRDRIRLQTEIYGTGQMIQANTYELTQIVQHIVFTLARERDNIPQLDITLRQNPQAVMLVFSADGLQLDAELRSILFDRQGASHYRVLLATQRAQLRTEPNALHLIWPRSI